MQNLIGELQISTKNRLLEILSKFVSSNTGQDNHSIKGEVLETIGYLQSYYPTIEEFVDQCVSFTTPRKLGGRYYFQILISRNDQSVRLYVEISDPSGEYPEISIYNYTDYSDLVEL